MTQWDDVVSTALLGTERRPVDIDLELLDGVEATSPEGKLLMTAAVLATYRTAGAVPGAGGAVPPPASDDERPVASDTAAQLLELLLSGDVRVPGGPAGLVDEWLERSASSGRRLPPRLVPKVLDAASADTDLRGSTAAAAGPLELWLAARNERWSWLGAATRSDAAAMDDWESATTARRLEIIDAVRATERARAMGLIIDAWSSEPAATREAMLAAVGASLDADDEPLLERALDDRAKGVRRQAAALLDRLPTSSRARRMAARLAPLVSVSGRLRKGLVIDLPEELADDARRDGITDIRIDGLGTAAGWLVQMVTAAPLSWWPEHLSRDVSWIVDQGREAKELVLGWTAAAVRQQNPEWAKALLDIAPRPELLSTIAAVDRPGAERALRHLIDQLSDPALFPMLAAVPGVWSSDLSAAVVARYVRIAPNAPLLDMVTPQLARRLHPSAARSVEQWAAALPEATRDRRLVRELHHALTIRQTIAEELQ